MAGVKLSAIASGTTIALTDTFVGVQGGTTDAQYTGTQVQALLTTNAGTWTAAQTYTNSDIKLLGSSTGATTFTSANAGASNFTLTFPGVTDTVAILAGTQTLTNKTIAISSNTLTGVAPLASPTFTGTATMPDGSAWGTAVTFNTPPRLKGYTVSTLPAGVQGQMAFVTDALAPTFLGLLTGGSTTVTPVFYNGTAWVSM